MGELDHLHEETPRAEAAGNGSTKVLNALIQPIGIDVHGQLSGLAHVTEEASNLSPRQATLVKLDTSKMLRCCGLEVVRENIDSSIIELRVPLVFRHPLVLLQPKNLLRFLRGRAPRDSSNRWTPGRTGDSLRVLECCPQS